MQRGSLIMLAKPVTKRDYELAKRLGTKMPEKEVLYTISKGPFLIFCHIQNKSTLTIQIEELGTGHYDPSYFIEVQEPMSIDINEILVT